jgi:hypothetical protein
MVNFQPRTGVFLPAWGGNECPDFNGGTRGNHPVTNMNQKLSITFTQISGQDDTALILEVIAGEIRLGNVAGNETEFSWTIETS